MQNSLFSNTYINNCYVVFEHETNIWWLRFLKSGFRHCYILLPLSGSKSQWLEINPMSNQICFFLHCDSFQNEYIHYLEKFSGIKIVPVTLEAAPLKVAPIAPFTCVEFVKRVIGIHNRWIITPYRLYKFLNKFKIVGKKS